MLAITCRSGDTTELELPDGRKCLVKLVELKGDRAKLGFEAPKDVQILRHDVRQRIAAGEPRRTPKTPKVSA